MTEKCINYENFCECEPRARAGMKKRHATENNSILIGRPLVNYCDYCGKEKHDTTTANL